VEKNTHRGCGGEEEKQKLTKGRYTGLHTRSGSTLQLMFAVQQAAPALDALEGIVRGILLLVETEVVLVGLFVLELFDVSPNNDTDIELEEKANNVADDKTNLSTGG